MGNWGGRRLSVGVVMSYTLRLLATTFVAVALAACRAGSDAVGIDPSETVATTVAPAPDPAGQACKTHGTIDECLADREFRCYWGPNYAWPVAVDGDPCQPPDGMCQSELSLPFSPECTVDAANDATCRGYTTSGTCLADTAHRCWWTPQMGMPCSLDGTWCPPPPHCGTTADCAPHCWSSGPTISMPLYADCGCLTPPGGVCIDAAGDPPVPSGCVERPACDGTDICACLTGLGTCVAGELPNVCVCDGI